MSPNRRILLNVVATYGRSLYALAIGLFTARWVLMTLGEVDYGLIGVVGGLVGFLSFFNGLMAGSISRFYAFSVGQSSSAEDRAAALEDCRKWFNVAVVIHTVIPVVSLLIGYPIGEWAVRHYLTIPPDRVEACVWVFRISCVSCLTSMMTIPYQAMYTAKQEIAELTIYGFASTTLNFLFLCYMVTHEGDWFVRYAGWTAVLSILPSLIITVRSFLKYPECRYVPRYWLDWSRMTRLFRYSACRLISSVAIMSAFEGMVVLVNKMLGPARNAAMSVGNNVNGHALSLAGSLRGAFAPAITNAAGSGDVKLVERLACRMSVFSTLSIAVFAIPLFLEIDEVLRIWLKNPPAQAGVFIQLLLLAQLVDSLTIGQCLSVFAYEKIGSFQLFEALAFFIPLPVAYVVFSLGGGLEGVGIGFLMLYSFDNLGKLYFVRKQCGQSIRHWLRRVCLPLACVIAGAVLAAAVPHFTLGPSFWRIVLTTGASTAVFLPMTWFLVLSSADREMLLQRLKGLRGLKVERPRVEC